MSRSKDRHEAERWLLTAEEDLRAAQVLSSAGMYAHACFAAQQTGGKALKAMWRLLGDDPWGHSVLKLVREFPAQQHLPDREVCIEYAAALDRFYIPTRYPNGLSDLTPGQSYFRADAERGIEQASFLLEASRRFLVAWKGEDR